MSNWITIDIPEDVSLSDDGTEIEVLYDRDEGNYITIPIEFVRELLKEE